jgi:hypothetical protein
MKNVLTRFRGLLFAAGTAVALTTGVASAFAAPGEPPLDSCQLQTNASDCSWCCFLSGASGYWWDEDAQWCHCG